MAVEDLPPPTHPCWTRLVKGAPSKLKTELLALQLLIKRLETAEISDGEKARELHSFVSKYHRILASEIAQVRSLARAA
jgi:hypothetical protein